MKKTIFKKSYDGESICNVFRDVPEAFDERFNPELKNIPKDSYGFQQGKFHVNVIWVADASHITKVFGTES